jgi:nucleoside 2-deoxyribosyltransferase
MAAASRDFGFTEGSRDSDLISLTEFGRSYVYATSKDEEQKLLREAILKVDLFQKVLNYYQGANLPEMQYLGNTLIREFKLAPKFHEEFSKLFKDNCAFLGIGAGFAPDQNAPSVKGGGERRHDGASTVVLAEPRKKTGLKCFVAMSFRERETVRSKGFFDEVLRALIAPAGREAGFEVITANRDGSDVIQATIVNQLLDADLVIADLTENNPNVLFELGLRIAEDKPVALIRARGTPAIFDVDNMLRVFEYDPNLWTSTIDHDCPRLTEHVKAAWDNRDSGLTFMKILRERRVSGGA